MFNQSGSRRWTHFHSALQLAIQRSAHKWTFEDFAECFPLYTEEDANGASATFNSISEYIEAQNFRDLDKLFEEYNVQENIDTLHNVVNEAKDRRARSELGNDAWKADLEPQTAVCARTVPVLEMEAKRLRQTLEEVKAENHRLQSELEENMALLNTGSERALHVLHQLDHAYEEWNQIPIDDIEAWTVQKAQSLKPTFRM